MSEDAPRIIYPIDPQGLKAEFLLTGRIVVSGPTIGAFTIEALSWSMGVDRSPPALEGTSHPGPEFDTEIRILGRVVNDPDSLARIHLGLYGVYGRVGTLGYAYDFSPEYDGSIHHQTVSRLMFDREADDTWWSSPILRQDHTVANVHHFVEQSHVAAHPDWYSRISSSAWQGEPLWQSQGIRPNHNFLQAQGDVISTNDDFVAVDQFNAWLRAGRLYQPVVHYQLWTNRDLSGPISYGVSDEPDSVHRQGDAAATASSIVEGHNYLTDRYDANNAFERGIVSAHEMSHVFGEESEAGGCNGIFFLPTTTCNLMQVNIDNSQRRFYWVPCSQNEIAARWYQQAEWPGACPR